MSQRVLRSLFLLTIMLIISSMWNLNSYAQIHNSHHHNGRNHLEDWPDSLQTITVSGQAKVDSSHFHPLYFLDEDNDGTVDYQLGFGPYWYVPESGATRPFDGEAVTIEGGLISGHTPPLIAVFGINGLVWRDSTGAPPWSGGWVHRNASDTTFIFCPTDSLDWIAYPPQSMHGMMFPDSIYCQFEEMLVDSMPGMPDSSMFEGYYTENFSGHGNHMRGSGMMMGFNRALSIRFHYRENELHRRNLSEESIQARYLDSNLNWQPVTNSALDVDANTLTVIDANTSTFYVLSASTVTSVHEPVMSAPVDFVLFPNYPNPFNPQTTIRYSIERDLKIQLTVYDVRGRVVKQLFNGRQKAGEHSVVWDGINEQGYTVASGVYLVKLNSNLHSEVQKMTLLR